MEIDVKSCRLYAIQEANQEYVPIYSPLDYFEDAIEGELYDWMWIVLGYVRSLFLKYVYDCPKWYSKAPVTFMLETQVCKGKHIKLAFQATSRRSAADFAHCLKRIQKLWLEVDRSEQAKTWAASAKKADIPKLTCKTAMLVLLGSWGQTQNYRYNVVSDHPDVLFEGEIESKRTTESHIFHDVTYKQTSLYHSIHSCLNVIGREQERIQIARALRILLSLTEPRRIRSMRLTCSRQRENYRKTALSSRA